MIKKTISAIVSASVITASCMPLAFAAESNTAASASVFQIEKMQTEHLTDPIGIDAKAPVFSWIMKSDVRGQSQTAYQLFVADSEENLKNGSYVWDSGKTESDLSNSVRYEGAALSASTRYFWQVCVWDQNEASVMSPVAFFETGLMDQGWGETKWIGAAPADFTNYSKAVDFTIDADFIIDAAAFGLIFGAKDTQNFYMWQINAAAPSFLKPHQWTNGNPKVVGEQTDLGELFPTEQDILGKLNHITVKVVNGTIETYINGALADSRTVDPFELGAVGFHCAGYAYRVDNVVVKDGSGAVIDEYDFEDSLDTGFSTGNVVDGMYEITYGLNFPIDSGLWCVAPMLRREFELPQNKEIESARLYAAAAGIYDMEINGERVDDSYFNPGSTQYDKTLMYQTYDVTDLVSSGKNAVSAMLGHGWFKKEYSDYGNTLALYAKLLIKYKDGTSESVVTDNNWKYSLNSPLIADDYFMGEKYNALLEQDGWDKVGFDDSAWSEAGVYDKTSLGIGELVAQDIGYIRNTAVLKPVAVTEPKPGVYIYDFGQNFAGIPRIKLNSPKGQTVQLRYGEMLNRKDMDGGDGEEGTLYRKNLNDAYSIDKYTAKGTENEIFEPRFVYHGFRYMEISGTDKEIPAEDIEGIVLHTALDETGSFECSNELINKLWENTLWSQRSNFMGIPTDCPQRSERWGWSGDAHIFARTASYNMDTYQFFRKYLRDMRDGQTEDGKFRDVAPGQGQSVWRLRNGNATSGWGDAGVIIPWQMYQQYGDIAIIEENYASMCKWIEYLINNLEDPNVYIRAKGWTGDWKPSGETTPFGVTDTAYCAYSSGLLSKMAKLLNKAEDAAKYAEISDKFKAAWNSEFVNEDGSTVCDTQTSYVLGLQFGLFPDDLRASAAGKLIENIKRNGNHLTTGFLGVSYLVPVLSDMGYDTTAYRLLEQTEAPSWLYSVTTGSTTIWETWDALVIDPDGSSKVNATSFNHYSYGSVCEWLYKGIAGIDRDEENPGFKHFVLKPAFAGSLYHAKASYDSAYGTIVSDWSVDNNKLTYKAEIPANTTATLYLPEPLEGKTVTESGNELTEAIGVLFKGISDGKAVYELQSGSYEFSQEITPWEIGSVSDGFRDVKEADWFYPYVSSVSENKLMQGVSDTEFAPNDKVTRAMFVTVLYRMEGEPAVKNENIYSDVRSSSWYEKATVWANGNGIVYGKTDTTFEPDTAITREEIAALIYRYAKYKEIGVDEVIKEINTLSFNDIFDVSDWAGEAVNYCTAAGIITGDGNGDLNPKDHATRAETAAMLVRLADAVK